MVSTVLASVLKSYLGQYLELSDTSISVGSEVKLNNVKLKESALSELGLPVRCIHGKVSKLAIKIPWFNLFTKKTTIELDGLHLLVVPNTSVQYDERKELLEENEAKQKRLERAEQAKKLGEQDNSEKSGQNDSFAEKMAANIIRNLEISIKRVHLRYEDKQTGSGRYPFAAGVTLDSIYMNTLSDLDQTDGQMTLKVFKKNVELNSFAIYWRPKANLYSSDPLSKKFDDIDQMFDDTIGTKNIPSKKLKYLLGPISLDASLQWCPNPLKFELAYPEVDLVINMNELCLSLTKYQYQDFIMLLQSFEFMSRASQFRKYKARNNLENLANYHGKYKELWKFAFDCVYEGEVMRRIDNWSWSHMKKHIKKCKDYRQLYKEKLSSSKINDSLSARIRAFEDELDEVNIRIQRQLAEREVEKVEREKAEEKPSGFWAWWSGGAKKSEEDKMDDNSIVHNVKKLTDALTVEEKSKLYEVLDYQENAHHGIYPKSFIAKKLNFQLNSFVILIRDEDLNDAKVLKAELNCVYLTVHQRPSADFIKLDMTMENLTVLGYAKESAMPRIVRTRPVAEGLKASNLLTFSFENNPPSDPEGDLDADGGSLYDQRIRFLSSPLEITYDASTFWRLSQIFKTPDDLNLSNLQHTAASQLKEIRSTTTAGLQYVIDNHNLVDIDVQLMSSYVIIPMNGKLERSSACIVANLGSIKIKSKPISSETRNLKNMSPSDLMERLRNLLDNAYDKFNISLEDMQLLVALPNEDWKSHISESVSALFLLKPTSLNILLQYCLIKHDPELPLTKVEGSLDGIVINISDYRLNKMAKILDSLIEFKDSDDSTALQRWESFESMQSALSSLANTGSFIQNTITNFSDIAIPSKKDSVDETPRVLIQEIKSVVKFSIGKVDLSLSQLKPNSSSDEKIFHFSVSQMEVNAMIRSFDLEGKFNIGGLTCEHLLLRSLANSPVEIIKTEKSESESLFSLTYTDVKRSSPDFQTVHKSTLKKLELSISSMRINLHQDAILDIIDKVTNFISEVSSNAKNLLSPSKAQEHTELVMDEYHGAEDVPEMVQSASQDPHDRHHHLMRKPSAKRKLSMKTPTNLARWAFKAKKKVSLKQEEIELKIEAKLKSVTFDFMTSKVYLANMQVNNIQASYVETKTAKTINAKLINFKIMDPINRLSQPPKTYYEYIAESIDEKVFEAKISLYDTTAVMKVDNADVVDVEVEASMGRVKIVFLMKFINDFLAFLDPFTGAKELVVEKANLAMEGAAKSMIAAYANATRARLDIKMEAPLIIIPVHSSSTATFCANLGTLRLTNWFMIEGDNIFDCMQFNLTDLQVSRAKIDNDYLKNDIIGSCPVIHPVTFELDLRRNMNGAKAIDDPAEIKATGTIYEIRVELSKSDYEVLLAILQHNFSEKGSYETVRQNESQVVKKEDLALPIKTRSKGSSMSLLTQRSDRSAHFQEALKVKDRNPEARAVEFNFKLLGFTADLFNGPTPLEELNAQREQGSALARVQVKFVSVNGFLLVNSALEATARLDNLVLEDNRLHGQTSESNRIVRLMETKQIKGERDKSMIDISYNKTELGDQYVNMTIQSFVLVGSVPYLLEIANFFVLDEASSYEWQTTSQKTNMKEQNNYESKMSIFIQIEEPDIFLVENIEDINTDALMLNTKLQFKMTMSEGQMSMIASLENIRCHTCRFNPKSREESLAQILLPCTLSFTVSQNQGHGMRVNVNMSDFCLNVSFHSIYIIQNSVQAFLESMAEKKEQQSKKSISKEQDFSKLWETRIYDSNEFWFLKPDEALDALDMLTPTDDSNPVIVQDEQMILKVTNFVIKLESGLGNNTIPLILLESSFSCDIKNFTSNRMSMIGSMNLEVAYYNSKQAVWEPIIEPVTQVTSNGKSKKKRWDLNIMMQNNFDLDGSSEVTSPEEDEIDGFLVPERMPPLSVITLQSRENLELTITKSFLGVVNTLIESFGAATGSAKKDLPIAPFVVQNDTGKTITISLECKNFVYFVKDNKPGRIKTVDLAHHDTLNLFLFKDRSSELPEYISPLQEQSEQSEVSLKIKISGERGNFEIPVSKADKRFFPFPFRGDEMGDNHGLVSEVRVENGCKFITLRTIIQVKNHFHKPINLFVFDGKSSYLKLAKLDPDDTFNVPIENVYAAPYDFYFQIDEEGASMGVEPFHWRQLIDKESHTESISCTSRVGNPTSHLIVQGTKDNIFLERTLKRSCMSYILDIRPILVLKNCLPISMYYMTAIDTEVEISSGASGQIQGVTFGETVIKFFLKDFRNLDWQSSQVIERFLPDLVSWRFTVVDRASGNTHKLNVSVNVVISHGTTVLSIFSPFWMVNKTGKDLSYKGQDPQNIIEHPHETEDFPVMFSYITKGFMGNRKVSLRVGKSSWSEPFTLDTIEDSGKVTCKWTDGNKRGSYYVGVNINMSKSSLTKIVTFTPYYIILNSTQFPITVNEVNSEGDSEISHIPQGECQPFWPATSQKHLKASISGSSESTPIFSLESSNSSLLSLGSKYGGINVEYKISSSECLLTLSPYAKGFAPALLVNSTSRCMIEYMEVGDESKTKNYLAPTECALFTWKNPLGSRNLAWFISGYSDEYTNPLVNDGEGVIELDPKRYLAWVSFLDGMQRVLLFTEDPALCYKLTHSTGENERIEQEFVLSMQGVGISIVNNSLDYSYELLYCSISSSDIVWEVKRKGKGRFKSLTRAQCDALEEDFQTYSREKSVGRRTSDRRQIKVLDSEDVEIDYSSFKLYEPVSGTVRRQFQKGLWLQVRSSLHQMQVHAQINRIQIDNQLKHCLFPVIMAPVPPPKSVVADSIPKPFIELSVLQYKSPERTSLRQFKYIHALVQELHIKIDQGLLTALLDLIEEEEILDEDINLLLSEDLGFVKKPLQEVAKLEVTKEAKDFFDFLHLSPLKVHVSFSLTSYKSSKINTTRRSTFLGLLLQSFGVTITDTDDIIFRLAYFERKHQFYSSQDLINEMLRHYSSQAIKQAYVIILGLDVIGNPFGLVVGVTKSVEDLFYEPFQGAVEGPGEFAEGMYIGVRSVFSGVVGGTAGAFSKITGAFGKGLASLTFDEKFQSKRRETIKKRGRQTVGEGLARSSKGLVMGFVDGVTGVALKPIEGAKQEGVGGFFKGVGKGVVGLVARPTGGIADFASGTLDTVKRVAENTEEIERLRPARFLHSDGIVRNYNRREAVGNKILNDTEKGRYAETDVYVSHFEIPLADRQSMLMITSRRLMFVSFSKLQGTWNIEWEFQYNEITGPPSTGEDESYSSSTPAYIIIKPKEERRRVLGIFGGGERGKKVFLADRAAAQKCARKIEELRLSHD